MVLDDQGRVEETLITSPHAHEGLHRARAPRTSGIDESRLEDHGGTTCDEFDGVIVAGGDLDVWAVRMDLVEDPATVGVGLASAAYEFGARGASPGARRFGADQGDAVDAGVNLGAA